MDCCRSLSVLCSVRCACDSSNCRERQEQSTWLCMSMICAHSWIWKIVEHMKSESVGYVVIFIDDNSVFSCNFFFRRSGPVRARTSTENWWDVHKFVWLRRIYTQITHTRAHTLNAVQYARRTHRLEKRLNCKCERASANTQFNHEKTT